MQLDDAATILAHADFFEICDNEQRRLLAFASEKRLHVRGATICKAGEIPGGAHILVSGVLGVAMEGEEVKPREVREPGTVIGITALILAKPRPLMLKALTAGETLYVPRSAFNKLMQQSPDLAQRAAAHLRQDLASYLSAVEAARAKFTKP